MIKPEQRTSISVTRCVILLGVGLLSVHLIFTSTSLNQSFLVAFRASLPDNSHKELKGPSQHAAERVPIPEQSNGVSHVHVERLTTPFRSRSPQSEQERVRVLNGTATPPLDAFWNEEKQTPTPQAKFLLDYVVAGFPKAGTTTLGSWLKSHPSIKSTKREEYYIWDKDMNSTVRSLYNDLFLPWQQDENPIQMLKGFRCPHQIHTEYGIKMLTEVFQESKLIVSVRHPVSWFQSYYNYRLEQNDTNLLKGSPNELIGNLKGKFSSDISPWLLQTATGEFHRYLAALRKTPLSDPEELALLDPFWDRNWNLTTFPTSSNPIFLCEMSQLSDKNDTRLHAFRKSLQNFLGLDTELPPILHVRPRGIATENFKNLDICEERYAPVRAELMNVARHASMWLRKYFMKSNDVYFSSEESLKEALLTWMVDPCL
jgi:hypothetical protein